MLPVSGDSELRAASRRWRVPTISTRCNCCMVGAEALVAGAGAVSGPGVATCATTSGGSAAAAANGEASATAQAERESERRTMGIPLKTAKTPDRRRDRATVGFDETDDQRNEGGPRLRAGAARTSTLAGSAPSAKWNASPASSSGAVISGLATPERWA